MLDSFRRIRYAFCIPKEVFTDLFSLIFHIMPCLFQLLATFGRIFDSAANFRCSCSLKSNLLLCTKHNAAGFACLFFSLAETLDQNRVLKKLKLALRSSIPVYIYIYNIHAYRLPVIWLLIRLNTIMVIL